MLYEQCSESSPDVIRIGWGDFQETMFWTFNYRTVHHPLRHRRRALSSTPARRPSTLVYLLPALACLLSALVSCRKSFRAELDKLTLTHIFMIRNISQLLNRSSDILGCRPLLYLNTLPSSPHLGIPELTYILSTRMFTLHPVT